MPFKKSLLVILSGILVIAGCESDDPNIDTESAIPVRTQEIERKNMKEYAFATGTVVAVNEASFKAEQSGYYRLQKNPRTGQPFAMGDKVLRGETVIRLENPEFEYSVTYDSKKLNFEISEREFEKQKAIYDKGGITLRELTDAERTFIDARYAFDNATLQLAKLRVIALFDGILVDLPYYSEGQLVETGSTLAQMMDYSKLVTEITLPGKEMERVTRGQDAFVTNYTKPSDTLTGTITQVSPALDPDSRMFKLALQIDNEDLILRPGMFVKLDIIVDEKDSAIVIPKDVILDRRGQKVVFVLEKQIAHQRTLELGLSNQLEAEVLSGVDEGDRLVIEGFETLRNRSKVNEIK